MKFKFSTVIVTQVQGEVEVGADHIHVFTKEGMRIIPTFMTDNSEELKEVSEEDQKTLFHIVTQNVLARAAQQLHVPGVTVGQPVSMVPGSGEVN